MIYRVLAELTVNEEVGVPRVGELVIVGVRVPNELLTDATELGVCAGAPDPAPAQVLHSHAELCGGAQWLSIAFPLSCAATATAEQLTLVACDHPSPQTVGIAVRDTGDGIVLASDDAELMFAPGQYVVRPGALLPAGAASTGLLNGAECRAVVDAVEVVHGGPLLAELTMRGSYVSPAGDHVAGFACRARVAAGTSTVELAPAIVVDGASEELRMGRWDVWLGARTDRVTIGVFDRASSAEPPVAFGHTGGGHPRGIFAVSTVAGGGDWRDASAPGYQDSLEWAELHGPVAQNWAILHGPDADRTLAVERFCEHHPARVSCERDAVTVGLFDGTSDTAVLVRGTAPRRRLAIALGSDQRAGARLDHPLAPSQPDLLSQLRPDVLPYLPAELPNLESYIRAELFGWYLAGQSLGFYDHGDGMQAIPAGPRVGYSSNNEHDALYALLLHYLRSGERAYFDSAIAYGDHTVDIDQIHASDLPHELGGLRAHGRSHVHYVDARIPDGTVRTSIDTGHMWVQGLILLGQITGETRYLDAARAVGDCLNRLEKLGWTRPEPGPRNAGWPLIALSALAAATADQRYLDAAQRIADTAIARQESDGRWLMRLGYLRDYCAWQNAVLLVGLSRLHALTGSAELRRAIERGGRALLDLGRTPEGTFIYLTRYDYRWAHRSGLVREALACLFALTGDEEYLRAGLLGGVRWYPAHGRTRVTSEDIAEWRGHLPFLGHAYRAGLLEDLP